MTEHVSRYGRYTLAALCLLAAGYLISGLVAMWLLSPRVPYADAWRFLAHFIEAPFPQDILRSDNGHREVLPNAVRVFELHVFAGQQWFQVAVGMVLALATLVLAALIVLRERPAVPTTLAATLFATVGLFWLGNVRALAHGNESVHAYFVTLFLVGGIGLLSRPPTSAASEFRNAAIAAALGVAATFSFGSGIACFVAYAAVLALRRASWQAWALIGAGLLIALVPTMLGPGSQVSVQIALLLQIEHLLRWLSAPFVYAFWPLLDPAIAMQFPVNALRVPSQAVAQSVEGLFGPVMLARWPHALIGVIGLAWLAVETWRAWHRPLPGALLGVGMAWFAATVGGMVALTRLEYLQLHPEQLLASRYVVWSSLFWAGLAIAATVHTRRPLRASAWALLTALVLLPSHAWMGKLGWSTRAVAERTALAAATGVIEPDLALGETVPHELANALPGLRGTRSAMFAWPETAWLGQTVDLADVRIVDPVDITVVPVENRMGEPGRRVRFSVASLPVSRLLLLDGDGVARGLALREHGRGEQWIGWMQGGDQKAKPRLAIPAKRYEASR